MARVCDNEERLRSKKRALKASREVKVQVRQTSGGRSGAGNESGSEEGNRGQGGEMRERGERLEKRDGGSGEGT